MIEFNDFLRKAIELKASDIHITAGIPPTLRINGVLTPVSKILLSKTDTEKIVRNIMSDKEYEDFIQIGELDFHIISQNLPVLE